MLIGLGANIGDPLAQLREAIDRLPALLTVTAISSVYRSPPVGFTDQPDFLNLVCAGVTPLSPVALQRGLQRVEHDLGRVRSFRNAPRIIDIDLLDYGGIRLDSPDLTLPHPRMHERAFVLVPLAEIEPLWIHPVSGQTAVQLMDRRGAVEPLRNLGPLVQIPGALG